MTTLPGCFGSAISYDSSDSLCTSCEHYDECGDKSYQALQELRSVMDVEKTINKYDKDRLKAQKSLVVAEGVESEVKERPRGDVRLTREQIDAVRSIGAKKPMKMAFKLLKRGLNGEYIKKSIEAGKSPFSLEPPHFLDVACRLLMGTGFTRRELALALFTDKKTTMSIKTAYSHVSIAVKILPALGVIKERGERFVLTD